MPKIPLSNPAGFIQQQTSAVPISSGVGADYKMDESKALMRFGEMIGNAGSRIASKLEEYEKKKEYTENRLAAAEARSLYKKINSELELKMRENPASYEEFGKWAEEADKKYAEALAPITGRMSEDYRKEFEMEMSGIRSESVNRRKGIGTQAFNTARYNLFQAQFKDAALRGDKAEVMRTLEEQRGELISEEEYQMKLLDYVRLSAHGEVKQRVYSDDPNIIEELKERDQNGAYVNHTGLTENDRDTFIRIAEGRDKERRYLENKALVDELNTGKNITPEEIEKKFEGQTSPAAIEQKLTQKEICRKVQHARAGYKAKMSEAKRKAEETKEKREFDNFHYQIYDFQFSDDPDIRKKQYNEVKSEILKRYPTDGSRKETLQKQLDAKFEQKTKPEKSYKNSTLYKEGEKILDLYKLQGRFFADINWWWKDDTSKNTVNMIEQAMKLDLDEFVERNPGASVEALQKELDGKIKSYNRTTAEKIGEMMMESILRRDGRRGILKRQHGKNGGVKNGAAE